MPLPPVQTVHAATQLPRASDHETSGACAVPDTQVGPARIAPTVSSTPTITSSVQSSAAKP
ncbi:MAG: hypothetical protein HY905_22330 [Deltaproteobacteria bacterium]|nr:hypothetical protein [Deltaproteobacteria bacterium]